MKKKEQKHKYIPVWKTTHAKLKEMSKKKGKPVIFILDGLVNGYFKKM